MCKGCLEVSGIGLGGGGHKLFHHPARGVGVLKYLVRLRGRKNVVDLNKPDPHLIINDSSLIMFIL